MSNNENIVWHEHQVSKQERSKLKKQKPCILWFTGLSGSGKSTIANAVESRLLELQKHTYLLDGDNIRMGLNYGLGFSDEDRVENIRRIGEVAKLFVDSGLIVLSAFISPFQREREMVRKLVKRDEFIEIFIDTPLEVCQSRDPKGLYEKARKGEIPNFTGISSPYEAPDKAEINIKTDKMSLEESVEKIVTYLEKNGYFSGE
ncbi:adenylyl-sulfate kinase [Sulfurimonas sediminis]|uniref:Adenylyl-sulfate kinase n=1 Tax=Sulfurimonas sediminis TaxID=2590020 RepID=A0A7M1AYW1_9BACT|nr:adenylyl-sulfate kinase [Sulfurimonas sediminis]QOP42643.1 adenylyl-sulfate kinase [Sulfurimonas sediminis]